MKTKKCSKCGEVKDVSCYGFKSKSSNETKPRCKGCDREYMAEWRQANRDKVKAINKRHYQKNSDSLRKKGSEYYSKNSVAAKERARKYRANNKDKAYKTTREWVKRNRARVSAYSSKRRSLEANAEGNCSPEKWINRLDYYGGRCVYCGSEVNITMEHRIPLSRGGTNWPANIVPACRSCNCKKNTKTEFEFKALLSKEN